MNFLINLFILWSYKEFSNHPDEHSNILTKCGHKKHYNFCPELENSKARKKTLASTPFLFILFPLRFASFFLVNPRDTGRPKLLNELPKIANWYLSTSSIIGGRIRRIVCPSSILATWQVRQMGVLLYFLERFMCGEWMYVSSLKMDGKTCMLQLQLRQARMQTVLV